MTKTCFEISLGGSVPEHPGNTNTSLVSVGMDFGGLSFKEERLGQSGITVSEFKM